LKVSIFVFILGTLAGSVVAQENDASFSMTFVTAEAMAITAQAEDMIGEASSASEGHVSSIALAERPVLRPGERHEILPWLMMVQHRDDVKASQDAVPSFNLDYGNNQMAERAIDERIIDRFASFEPSDGGRSGRYSVSFDLEHEDSDWNFEVTVTVEF
jgi:hypothetical protein